MILESIGLAITAWVYVMILLKPGMILGWLWRYLDMLPEWMSEPLGGCEYCVAGQFAFWYYLYKNWNGYGFENLIGHIIFVSLTIFIVEIINVWKQNELT